MFTALPRPQAEVKLKLPRIQAKHSRQLQQLAIG